MDYDTGKMLEVINSKLDFLIEKLQEAEKKANGEQVDKKK